MWLIHHPISSILLLAAFALFVRAFIRTARQQAVEEALPTAERLQGYINERLSRAGYFGSGNLRDKQISMRQDDRTNLKQAAYAADACRFYLDLAKFQYQNQEYEQSTKSATAALDIFDRFPMHYQERGNILPLCVEGNLRITEIEDDISGQPAEVLTSKYTQILSMAQRADSREHVSEIRSRLNLL